MPDVYAPEYSTENIQNLLGGYEKLLEPSYQRSRGQLANILGGRGVFSGTPASNTFQLLESQRLGQVGQYGQNLLQDALAARRGERLTSEERAYQRPFTEAQLTGAYQGAPTLQGQQSQSNLLSEALQRQYYPYQFERITPYQQSQLDILRNQQDLQNLQNILNSFGGVTGLLGMLGGGANWLSSALTPASVPGYTGGYGMEGVGFPNRALPQLQIGR